MNISSFGRRLLQAADGTVLGTIVGLGTAAYKNTGTSGNNVPLLDGANTWSAIQTFSANPSVTGGAISFPATQIPSAGANDLDDYEEGTWTPGFAFGGGTTGITYATQTGTYTKVGRLVYVQGRITLSAKGSSTGAATITGLPFNPSVSSPASVGFFASFSGLVDGFFLLGGASAFTMRTGGATSAASLTDANLTNTSDIIFSSIYPT